MTKITPFFWYAREAEEAATFYTSIFPDSRIKRVMSMPAESPSGPPGSVKVVDFELFGQPFTAMSAARGVPFNQAISLVVSCEDQAEIDRYWDALTANGGAPVQCGWLKDRFGVSWQIVPKDLVGWMADTDRVRGGRVAIAMMKMVKFDIAGLRAAYEGTTNP